VTCPTDETLTAFTAGLLPDGERAMLEDHAAGCPLCRSTVAALAGVRPGDRDAVELGAEGAAIGRYRITGTIGEGAMGVVLRGYDPVLDREVAIKMSRAFGASPAERDRAIREAQALARLDHPNVVRVFDAGSAGEEVFVAMEYVAGTSLTRWNDGTRSRADKLRVLAGVGAGLAAVHAAGLVHRDVKPDNILVRANGEGTLVDFGLARGETVPGATGSGLAGTPAYLAPEVRAGAPASAKSDQYAWWTVVAELLGDDRPLRAAIARGRGERFPSMTAAVAALAPRRRSRRWLALLAIPLAIAGVLVATRGTDRCASAVPGRWQTMRAPIVTSLAAAGADTARVIAALDARAARTAVLERATCERGDDPAAQRERLCVDDTWRDTTRLFAGLLDADPTLRRAAVDELVLVLPVDRCATGTLPAIPAPPPPAKLAQAEALEKDVREINLAGDTPPQTQLKELRALAPRVTALDDAQLAAHYHSALASALVKLNDLAGASAELEATVKSAEIAGDDDSRVRALVNIVRLAGDDPSGKPTVAEERAEAAAARLANPGILAELHLAEAMVRFARGDLAAAIAKLEATRTEYAAIAIDVHDQQVTIEQNLGGLLQSAGKLAEAQLALDRAYAYARARYGDRSSRVLVARGARATNLLDLGRIGEARSELQQVAEGLVRQLGPRSPPLAQAQGYLCECDVRERASSASCDTALATAEAVFGADNPQLVWFLVMVGQARTATGGDAITPLERALAISAHGTVMPNDRALAAGFLALALHAAHRDPARAHQLAREARTALATLPDQPALAKELDAAFPER